MNEKEALKTITAMLNDAIEKEKQTEGTHNTVIWHAVANDYRCAIKALEEIQQYRAIGTFEEVRELFMSAKSCLSTNSNKEAIDNLTLELFYLTEYREIGTLDECRAAVEKQRVKDVIPCVDIHCFGRKAYYDRCPNCEHVIYDGKHCCNCGQRISWEIYDEFDKKEGVAK